METGVQDIYKYLEILDSGFRRNDGEGYFGIFFVIISLEGALRRYGKNYD